jgi:predicted enzyme related to lactoylglutathione lyase
VDRQSILPDLLVGRLKIPAMAWLITNGKRCNRGGMMERQNPSKRLPTIDVSSVEEYSAKVEKLGGKIVVPKKAVPGMGYFAICLDTENNAFGLWENNKQAR